MITFEIAHRPPPRSMEWATLHWIVITCAYQLGFYVTLRRWEKEMGHHNDGFTAAKISTHVHILRSLLAGCPGFSREVALWIKKGIEGARF